VTRGRTRSLAASFPCLQNYPMVLTVLVSFQSRNQATDAHVEPHRKTVAAHGCARPVEVGGSQRWVAVAGPQRLEDWRWFGNGSEI